MRVVQIYYIVLHGKQGKNEEKNEKVIDGLKKYNKTMLILKIIIMILSIFIIFMWGKIIIKRVEEGIKLKENYEKGQYIYDIIDKVYCNINEIKKTDNYSLIEESTSISYDFNFVYNYTQNKMFYKEGYFKEEYNTSYSNGMNLSIVPNYVNYGVVTKDKTFYTQSTNGYSECSIASSSGTTETMNNILEMYHKENVLDYKDYEIREEKIAEKKYYVISNKENMDEKVYYYEIWIDKDNMQLYKITNEKVGCQKTETKFTLTVGNVKDEDVRLSFAGKSEKIQSLSKLFDKINNGEFEDDEEQAWIWNFGLNSSIRVSFDNYVETNKKLITPKEVMEIIEDKYKMKSGGYSYKSIIFDQNGDAYYAYSRHETIEGKNTFIENIFVSIFGDIIKTNNIDKELKDGEVVVL